MAEHHNLASVASSAPEIMIGQIAAATTHIRVGSGGVMLPNHAPLMVAERFKVLEALFPGRIDLGLGRAPGTDPRPSLRAAPPPAARHRPRFPGAAPGADPVREQRLSGRSSVPQRARDAVRRPLPPIWLLGSSRLQPAELAARSARASPSRIISPDYDAVAAMPELPRPFWPSGRRVDKPYAMLAVAAVCRRQRRRSGPAGDDARSQLGAPRARRMMPLPARRGAEFSLQRRSIDASSLHRRARLFAGTPETDEKLSR